MVKKALLFINLHIIKFFLISLIYNIYLYLPFSPPWFPLSPLVSLSHIPVTINIITYFFMVYNISNEIMEAIEDIHEQ